VSKSTHKRVTLNGHARFKAMTAGDVFGNWTLIELDLSTDHKTDKHRYWWCSCVCGKRVSVSGSRLRRGESLSCGCNAAIEEVGRTYGRLTVVSFHSRPSRWLCRCACGNTLVVHRGALRTGNTTSCGCYRREFKTIQSKQRRTVNTLLKSYMYRASKGAAPRGYVWSLTTEDVRQLIFKPCTYCGAPPTQRIPGYPEDAFRVNGIDRMDNAVGYVKENCVPCCTVCNRIKSTMTYTEFRQHVTKIALNMTKTDPLSDLKKDDASLEASSSCTA
jgi:hypothetical protein